MPLSFLQDNKVIHRPIPSKDNKFLALICLDSTLEIVDLEKSALAHEAHFPKSLRAFLTEIQYVRWAPEVVLTDNSQPISRPEKIKTWLLLASASRIVTIELDLSLKPPLTTSVALQEVKILADYQFDAQFGKIGFTDFVLNHDHAVVTFEMNTHVSLISFNKAQRDDIPNPKFSHSGGIAQPSEQNKFGLMLRSNGQDRVAIFTSQDDSVASSAVFSPGTVDAHGLLWSPNKDPVIAVWESTTHNAAVYFFTPMGHPLKGLTLSLDITALESQNVTGVGISSIAWVKADDDTLLVVGLGGTQLLLRRQNHNSMHILSSLMLPHEPLIDGSKYPIWQQLEDGPFECQKATLKLEIDALAEINIIKVNANTSMVATVLNTVPKVVWLWSDQNTQPVGLLMFHYDIKEMNWHPSLPNVLAVITKNRLPCIHVVHDVLQSPKKVMVPFQALVMSSKWTFEWLSMPNTQRCPLLVYCNKQFGVGLVEYNAGQVTFNTILQQSDTITNAEEETSLFDTPSKPEKKSSTSIGWKLDNLSTLDGIANSDEEW